MTAWHISQLACGPDDAAGSTLTKFRIGVDRFIRVLECLRERDQLHVRCGAVVVPSCIGWIALDALGVVLDRPGEVARLELDVSLFARDGALRRVDVCFAVFLGLLALDLAQLVEDFGRAVLGQRFLVVLDGLYEVALLLVRRAEPAERFCDELVVGAKLKQNCISAPVTRSSLQCALPSGPLPRPSRRFRWPCRIRLARNRQLDVR